MYQTLPSLNNSGRVVIVARVELFSSCRRNFGLFVCKSETGTFRALCFHQLAQRFLSRRSVPSRCICLFLGFPPTPFAICQQSKMFIAFVFVRENPLRSVSRVTKRVRCLDSLISRPDKPRPAFARSLCLSLFSATEQKRHTD